MHRLRGSRSGFRFSRASCCRFLCRCLLSIVIESLLNFFRRFGKVNLRYSRTAREHNAIRFDSFYRDVFVLRPVGAQAVRLGGSCSDKDIAPARNWSERGGQAATAYRTIKDSEKTNRVHANKQPQRRPVETLAQRFYARDRCAKDRNRQCHGEAKTGRAQLMFVIQCAIRRQNYHDHEPSTKPRQLGESVSLHWNRM